MEGIELEIEKKENRVLSGETRSKLDLAVRHLEKAKAILDELMASGELAGAAEEEGAHV
jgi:hypothetical protein